MPGTMLGAAFLEVKDRFCPGGVQSLVERERERECEHTLTRDCDECSGVLGEPREIASSSVGAGRAARAARKKLLRLSP